MHSEWALAAGMLALRRETNKCGTYSGTAGWGTMVGGRWDVVLV